MPDKRFLGAAWRVPLLLLIVAAFATAVVIARKRPLPPRGPGEATVSEERHMLGTTVTLTVTAKDEPTAREHLAAGFARIAQLEQTLSLHRPDSELSRFNARAGGGSVAVSDDLYRIIAASVAWHGNTQGAFDIAVGPLVELWRACGQRDRLPTPEELAQVKPLLGADRIILDPAARTVRLPVEGMRLDLGGPGKGYIADEVTKLLKARGVTLALISMSGDIDALGRAASGAPWRIGVQDPRQPRSPEALVTVLQLADRSVSTSGNYERFVEIGGRRYSHIVDPRTCWTADSVAGVTVIGPDGLTTDVLDTALSVLGVEDGLALVEKIPGVEALFITVDERKEMHLTRSKGFGAYETMDD